MFPSNPNFTHFIVATSRPSRLIRFLFPCLSGLSGVMSFVISVQELVDTYVRRDMLQVLIAGGKI